MQSFPHSVVQVGDGVPGWYVIVCPICPPDTNELRGHPGQTIDEDVGTYLQVRHPDLLVDLHVRGCLRVTLGRIVLQKSAAGLYGGGQLLQLWNI
jgi:hypothetical protein